jgi:3-phenylpropionate/trans-cinnamate dioxygenase ferredoxin reductase subunit
MRTTNTHLIVGAGLAGATAAATLRKEGYGGRIVLLGDEADRPYDRPELSKKYLRAEPESDPFLHEPGFYREAGIDLVTGRRVRGLDVRARRAEADGETFEFDRLLIATGSAPRRLDVPGADLDGVVMLRTRADADDLRERALEVAEIAVIGGGWIGSEVAASLRQLGRSVTLIMSGRLPLERVLGMEVATVFQAAHVEHGVRIEAGATVVGFAGERRVSGVRLADGRVLPADLVVVGVGAWPRTELAEAAGLMVRNAIVVDERLQTSVPGVFAAGDVASAWHPFYGRHLRVEHRANAKRQGQLAAANMLGQGKTYERVPFFYSDQYDIGMEYTGYAPRWDRVVLRGDPAGREFIAFWLADGRIVAGMNLNIWDVAPIIEQLVTSRAPVDVARLSDPRLPLSELAQAA